MTFFFIKPAAAAVFTTHDRLAGRDDGESESETVRAVFKKEKGKESSSIITDTSSTTTMSSSKS